jgi:uncharacterized damage-inducible protein DinB
MAKVNKPEVWLRGPVAGVPPLLQPVAHALLQAREEVKLLVTDFPESHLWARPAELASPGFHLQHLSGVIDRLFTYAKGQSLTEEQEEALAAEGKIPLQPIHVEDLFNQFSKQVDQALEQLRNTKEAALLEQRGVGRAQLPSNVLGLLFHAAEHTQRHVGQLLVTVRVIGDMKK